jgi:hypothetical protein
MTKTEQTQTDKDNKSGNWILLFHLQGGVKGVSLVIILLWPLHNIISCIWALANDVREGNIILCQLHYMHSQINVVVIF